MYAQTEDERETATVEPTVPHLTFTTTDEMDPFQLTGLKSYDTRGRRTRSGSAEAGTLYRIKIGIKIGMISYSQLFPVILSKQQTATFTNYLLNRQDVKSLPPMSISGEW